MGEFDDHGVIGDWMLPSPSSRNFFASMMDHDAGFRSIPGSEGEEKNESIFSGGDEKNLDEKDGEQANGQITKPIEYSERKTYSRGGLVERMAARAGFDAPRLNTESITQNPEIRSPYLTIPAGLSPTTLLDSPVFLTNSLVQPSPTTGKFQLGPSGNGRSSIFAMEGPDKNKYDFFDNLKNTSFEFKPIPESRPSLFLGEQSFPSPETSVQSENSLLPQSAKFHSQNGTALHYQHDLSRPFTENNLGDNSNNNVSSEPRPFGTVAGDAEHSPPLMEQQEEDADRRVNIDTNAGSGASEDGYNWRKYGQKQVKGSEYPRSYYKCTHPNCPVKKKVERSHEGNITEIIYKGAHSHPKPPPNRRSGVGSSNPIGDMQPDTFGKGGPGGNVDPVWATTQNDNLEVTSSEYYNSNGARIESGDGVDRSLTFSNDEDEDDRATHGSVSLGQDGEGDESESKRRRVEAYAAEVSGANRTIREPRVVVQTTSEVDILDDGYRWRKYGQKVVKGNPNPRSYYKCTSTGCTVRKHVERASHDLKSVITTYEGKHNHEVPAARNSSHANSGAGGSNNGPSQSASVQTQAHRPEHSNNMGGPHSMGSFNLHGRQPLGNPNVFPFGINQQGLPNFAMPPGWGPPNQGNLPGLPLNPYFRPPHPNPMNDMGFLLPKGEPKVEPMSEPGFNLNNASSVYHQIMGRLPNRPSM